MSVDSTVNEPGTARSAVAASQLEPKGRSAKRPVLVLVVLVSCALALFFYHRAETANQEETDDAQVDGDLVQLSVRAGGQVLHVRVVENERVSAGAVLVEIDPLEYQSRAAQAQADLEMQRAQAAVADSDVELVTATAGGGLRAARATVTSAVDSVRSAGAQVAAAQAGVARARAQAQQTSASLGRVRALRAQSAASAAELDNAQAADDAAQAAIAQAEAQFATATAMRAAATSQIGQAQGRLEQSAPVDVLLAQARARADLAHARVRSSEAALSLARLQLSYTTVTAPRDGVISRLGVREGQLLQSGQSIAMLVPLATYVVANFKETQVGRMRARDRAEIRVDAFPGRVFQGTVESVSGGTGARFSLLPPDNASGNFVKVVQRVPVRIRWVNVPSEATLRAGLSADVIVFVAP
jgi:membrane fusion protein (multidrug efflux system)